MEDRWLNDIRNKMSGYESAPPDGLWNDIDRAMERRRLSAWAAGRRAVLLRLAGVAAALAVVIPLGRNLEFPESGREYVKTVISIGQKQGGSTEALLADAHMPETENIRDEWTGKPVGVRKDVRLGAEPGHSVEKVTEAVEKVTESAGGATEKKDAKNDTGHSAQLPVSPEDDFYRNKGRGDGQPIVSDLDIVVQNKPHKVSVSLFAANIPGRSATDYNVGVRTLEGVVSLDENPEPLVRGVYPVAHARSENQVVDPHARMKHRQPVRFGLSVTYALNDRLSLESGLSYTYLSSRLSSSSENQSFRIRQSLQYVGLPLSLHAGLWKNERFHVYLSAGGMMEKCVAGKSESDYAWKGTVISSTHDNLVEKPLQFSVHAAAGVQVNLSSRIGLYAEPGVGYYFKNGSSVSNIYKEKPLNFNLEFGLRFSFGSR